VPQPLPYNRTFSFSNFQAQNPTAVPPGSSIDVEFNNVKASSDGVLANLARIQRYDGALANGSVSFDQLSPALQTAGLAPALPWVTGTAYSVNASVTSGSAFYRCLVAHTSGVFATDLAAGNWVLIVDFATIALVAASMIAVTPSGSLTSNVQTSLQALDSGKAPTSHTATSPLRSLTVRPPAARFSQLRTQPRRTRFSARQRSASCPATLRRPQGYSSNPIGTGAMAQTRAVSPTRRDHDPAKRNAERDRRRYRVE
jgi:hypothetical protein